jgi:enamidase
MPRGLDVLVPALREQFQRAYDRVQRDDRSVYRKLFPKGLRLERAFARAGGLLTAGTDPTGSGGVIPGFANQREIELLVEEGFSPVEAISIATFNGAKYLGRDARIGSIAVGKQADLLVVNGDPSRTIEDVRRVDTVFRRGVGFDPAKLVASVSGQVGIW